jgi:peptide/nickel transport system permease protein
VLGLLAKNRLVLVGTTVVVFFVVLAALSNLLVNPSAWRTENLLSSFCWNNPYFSWGKNIFVCPGNTVHPLGTDSYGRDLLQMIILAIPVDLEMSFAIVFTSFVIGALLGSVAAFAGGITDEIILRIADLFFAFPGLLLAIVFLAVFGRSFEILVVAVLITWWPLYVRLVRSQVLSEKQKPYVEALTAVGAGRLRIIFLHILPNTIYPAIVQLTLDLGGAMLVFSSLMFLGFTPNPMQPELGELVSLGINHIAVAPWLVIFPGLTIVAITMGLNLLGDGIRDILDPRLRR